MFKFSKVKNDQIIEVADFFANNDLTVREVSKEFNISKTTIHNYVSKYIKELDFYLYLQCRLILDRHIDIRCSNGGKAAKGISKSKRIVV